MIERVACLGLSHHRAPVAVREALCLSPAAQSKLHAGATGLRGFALLSTCNRLEFYVERDPHDERSLRSAIIDLMPPNHGSYLEDAHSYIYEHSGPEAARHLARVAAGLDSMVLGETQIQGQVQESFRQSVDHGKASTALSATFQAALKAGGRVRQETALSRNPVSVASVAVDLVRKTRGSINGLRVAIVGAGEMGRLTAKILRNDDVKQLIILNRTESRALDLAETMGGEVRPLAALEHVLHEVDAAFFTTRGDGSLLEVSFGTNREAPLMLMDLGVPRNVGPSQPENPSVRVFDMDHLRSVVDDSLALRRAEVPRAAAIVEEEVEALEHRLRALAVEPLIKGLRLKAETLRQEELSRTIGKINGLGPGEEERLRHFSQTLVNKLLHEPTTRLRERAATGDTSTEADVLRELFAL